VAPRFRIEAVRALNIAAEESHVAVTSSRTSVFGRLTRSRRDQTEHVAAVEGSEPETRTFEAFALKLHSQGCEHVTRGQRDLQQLI
jgi:hypothetical protein